MVMPELWNKVYFNPHSREGSDIDTKGSVMSDDDFNPHSREGSDPAGTAGTQGPQDFNPHSREGSDGASATAIADNPAFQSTLPRRE